MSEKYGMLMDDNSEVVSQCMNNVQHLKRKIISLDDIIRITKSPGIIT